MADTVLVTGGCGFIGTNFIRRMLKRYDYNIVNLDRLTYAGNLENLKDCEKDERYTFVRGDIASVKDLEKVFAAPIDIIVNFAAESHVDRSIMDPDSFIRTNINGTFNLLEMARKKNTRRFIQISTDEVYGSLGSTGAFREDTPLSPNSPYSASKTSADILAMAYCKTFGTPVIITRCSNNYGPYQFPEKLIPLIITNAMADRELPVYGDGLNVRDWIHVEDHCAAIDLVVHKGETGNVYNIGASNERTNIEIVKLVLAILGKPESLIRYVKDRPGHDRRYAIDSGKISACLGYRPSVDFAQGMRKTVEWYVENRQWWERIKTGAYLEYYEKMYGNR
ncbi:MAG: dTDP-glucose 4,6-dehydratase [Syntrophorhabdaceae bacterium]|nr:dTDP-glucose 4,6-dehydratase [Syntrophorhabdaceae bacterium]MDD4195484.1 dTDP-glucose 4,6-dehydratase [Syntrophorhabdaceae bacterium]HOC46379.1 dTDP-glucose 4,6-dehydratase [Syntrophorhabdaceae bacterium]